MKKTKYVAQLYNWNANTHIDRRVYEDTSGDMCVKINGMFFKVDELRALKSWDARVYFNGDEPVR